MATALETCPFQNPFAFSPPVWEPTSTPMEHSTLFSATALFDVASRQILARIDGPAYTSAILSPSGKLIAVEHEEKIRLYLVD
jgi:hypothetical protein